MLWLTAESRIKEAESKIKEAESRIKEAAGRTPLARRYGNATLFTQYRLRHPLIGKISTLTTYPS